MQRDAGRESTPRPSESAAGSPESKPPAVVGIGASAGGLEALRRLFTAMPNDTGATFVVVQHLSRETESLTPELLAGGTRMPVRFARDGDGLLPDTVLCLPPGLVAELEGNAFRLREDPGPGPLPTVIDTFFRSLARDGTHRAFGVLLSGAGSDGTLGLGAIRESGGLTFVQSPDEAEFDSMPRSALRAGAVDYWSSAAELAPLLARHLADGEPDSASDDNETNEVLAQVTKIISDQTGHDFSQYKPGTINRRLRRRYRLTGINDPLHYLARLREDDDEPEALFHDLLIGVTEFFRDPEAWAALRTDLLRPVVERASSEGRPLRAWVPACATGEEAYTLLILLEEEFSALGVRPDITLFATDIDERSLGFAREGLYPDGIADHVSAERLERFFSREDHHYRLDKTLREQCVFAVHNFLQDAPFSRQDVICCRNLLIYLQPEGQRRASSVFQYALRPDGLLMIGASENLGFHREAFETVDKEHRIFRRNEAVADAPLGMLGDGPIRRRRDIVPPRGSRRAEPGDARRIIERSVFHDYGPASVLVDDRYDVLHFFGRTSQYLEPSEARGGVNLLDMAPATMRAALRGVLREAAAEQGEVTRTALRSTDGEADLIEVVARPARELDGSGLFIVVFRPSATAGVAAPPDPDGGGDPGEVRAIRELEEELRGTRQRLQASIEELEGSNEELRSSNEELLSLNEEMQTAKEETQSVNEELKTVNAEVKAKIDALNRVHSDLQNLFRSTEIATIFLNTELEIRRFTPAATELFRLRDSDVGRPIGDIVRRFVVDGELVDEIAAVLETLQPSRSEVQAPAENQWFSLRIFPYRTVSNVIEGVVLTFTDVTAQKDIERQLRLQQDYAANIIASVPEPLVVVDGRLVVLSASPSFWERFGLDPVESRGKPLDELDSTTWDIPDLRRFARAPQLAKSLEFDLVLQSGEGQPAYYSVNAVRITEHGESTGRILLFLQDVTAARRRDQSRDEETRRKDWFLAMLGHEIRNPLAPIRNALDLLKQEAPDPAYRMRLLQIIERQLDQLTKLVNDVLDVSRITGGKLPLQTREVDAVTLVWQIAEDQRASLDAAGLDLMIERPDAALFVDADPTRVAQAVSNLLVNARRYTPRGGRVRIAIRREGARVAVDVIDSGIGMTRELARQVFEPFHKGPRGPDAEQGLGVGLTLVRAIIEEHGGDVRAGSPGPGRGATFTIRLPLVRAGARLDATDDPEATVASEPASADGRAGEGRVAQRRVLLVEDMEDTAETSRMLLEAIGCEVLVASTGEEALARVWDWAPDVVLSDIGLPGAMSGFDVARAIRASPAGRRMRLIALTGYGRDADRGDALSAGFNEFLVKPVRMAELRQVIATAD